MHEPGSSPLGERSSNSHIRRPLSPVTCLVPFRTYLRGMLAGSDKTKIQASVRLHPKQVGRAQTSDRTNWTKPTAHTTSAIYMKRRTMQDPVPKSGSK